MPARRTTRKGYEQAPSYARRLPLPSASKLWSRIRNDQLGVTFRRQHAIGNYIPDFCAIKPKLIIELDGSQHLEQGEYDSERTAFFESKGYRVLRFWNNDVMNNMDGVLKVIWTALHVERGDEQRLVIGSGGG